MADTLLTIAGATLIVCAGLAILAFGAVLLMRHLRSAPVLAEPEPDPQIAALARLQNETAVQVKTMADMLAGRQAELARHVNERLDAVTQHLGTSMQTATKHTVENLQRLNERLAVIDSAQKNLSELTTQVTSLRDVLSNKQARGAFGQGRMQTIVQDGLPKGHYEFQHTLKNGKRPDCVVFLPDQRPLVIDAKFPLEAITALRESRHDDDRKLAAQRVRQDVMKHVSDIAERYLIPGETQDIALMFVPSESVYAELHDGFDDVVQKAYRAQVMLVSPTLLMLAIQVIQQIQKDARMREAADNIRTEVGHMLKDVRLLGDRVRKLQTHFGQATEDMTHVMTSVGRIEKRGERIQDVEFGAEEVAASNVIAAAPRKIRAGEF
jgi:DNA recombination protein RmuC